MSDVCGDPFAGSGRVKAVGDRRAGAETGSNLDVLCVFVSVAHNAEAILSKNSR